jgi:hypothetical protein
LAVCESGVIAQIETLPSRKHAMAQPRQIIQFLRACYEADNRETAVSNLFNKSIRHLHFIEGEERLLSGLLPRIPLATEAAPTAMKDAALYRREKELLYCAFTLIGKCRGRGPRQQPGLLCAPLFLYPAKLVDDGSIIQLEVDLEQQEVNIPVLAELATAEDLSEADLHTLASKLPQAPFEKSDVQILIASLQEIVGDIEGLSLAEYPQLHGELQVQRAIKRTSTESTKLSCLPACALALTPTSPNTRGVLYELEQMGESPHFSSPLQLLLQEGTRPPRTKRASSSARVPAVLSRAQKAVLTSASTAPLSLVIGPPGTGKSYTIAAIAIDHLSRGESVLIACRKPQAVDVVARMIQQLLGPNQCVIRGGESRHVRELKKLLEQLLQGIRRQIRISARRGRRTTGDPNRDLKELDRQVHLLEADLARHLQAELRCGDLLEDPGGGFFTRLFRLWERNRLQRRLARQPTFWERIHEYDRRLDDSNELTRELLKRRIDDRVDRTLKEHRQDLTRFLNSLRSRSSTRQEKLFSEIDPKLLFGTFPVWLTSVADIAEMVPLEVEMFDVAIFDEATQCDMASCQPILQRAKRAVIVGDPNQLRHLSFLSRSRQKDLADEHGLNEEDASRFQYREKSLLDLVNERIASQDDVHFLNEHFRSMPEIIRFSNERFYQEALSVMRLRPKTARTKCLFSQHVPGGKKEGGANRREAHSVVDELNRLIEAQSALPNHACQSIGVLSPFRDQVDLLAELLEERLPIEALQRHDLRVGTAHAFQGDERDVMLLSFVLDNDAHHSSIRFLDDANLFNVAITRARHQQYVFHSVETTQLPVESLLRQYIESIDQAPESADATKSVVDDYLQEVQAALQAEGFRVWPDYELAGVAIDLVIEKEGHTLGIDLVGCPGGFGDALDLERYRILRRAGMPLFPLPYRCWIEDRDACLVALNDYLGDRPD